MPLALCENIIEYSPHKLRRRVSEIRILKTVPERAACTPRRKTVVIALNERHLYFRSALRSFIAVYKVCKLTPYLAVLSAHRVVILTLEFGVRSVFVRHFFSRCIVSVKLLITTFKNECVCPRHIEIIIHHTETVHLERIERANAAVPLMGYVACPDIAANELCRGTRYRNHNIAVSAHCLKTRIRKTCLCNIRHQRRSFNNRDGNLASD